MNVWRGLILTEGFQRTKLRNVFTARFLKFRLRVLFLQQATAKKRLFHTEDGRLDKLPDNHARSRSHCGTTVWYVRGVGLSYFDQIKIKAECFGGNLRKDRVCALANLGARRQHFYATLRTGFGAHNRLQKDFAGTGKPCAMHE